MANKPILMSGPMVRAILEGRKTQTRRVLKAEMQDGEHRVELQEGRWFALDFRSSANLIARELKVPYAVGDLLWVRETLERANGEAIGYPADRTWLPNSPWRWQRHKLPSIHMPRWASRLTLEVTAIKVERLQDISEEDAIAEGIRRNPVQLGTWMDYPEGTSGAGWSDPRNSFRSLWSSTYGPDAWDANPWVIAITFKPHKCNVDALGLDQTMEPAA